MERDLDRLIHSSFDVAVVGGGILGAFVALLVARRGARVVLLEKGDFASGTTSGSGKVLHGGIRYLQSLRLGLALEAQREQRALADLVPDLVRPLPFLVPCREGRYRERLVLEAGVWAWKCFTRLVPDGVELPPTRYVGAGEAAELTDDLARPFQGGMLFHDAQLRSPERLTFEVVRAAARAGAIVANYAEVVGIQSEAGWVTGLDVRDRLEGAAVRIDTPRVVNAAGAWAPDVAAEAPGAFPDVALGKGIHVVVDRPPPAAALALPLQGEESDDPSARGERRVFVMPWEGRTLVGASYSPFGGRPDEAGVSREEISGFLGQLHRQWPDLGFDGCRVLFAYSGLYPVFGRRDIPEGRFAASLHPLVLDHADHGGPEGLISAVSVKLTTARALAERVVDKALPDRDSDGGRCGREASRPGRSHRAARHGRLRPHVDRLGKTAELPYLARRAARDEMAMHLSDVLFRRTWIGHLGHPGPTLLGEAARAMAGPLGWTEEEEERQVHRIDRLYRALGIGAPPAKPREGDGEVDGKSGPGRRVHS